MYGYTFILGIIRNYRIQSHHFGPLGPFPNDHRWLLQQLDKYPVLVIHIPLRIQLHNLMLLWDFTVFYLAIPSACYASFNFLGADFKAEWDI
jgi:hypothetical protein